MRSPNFMHDGAAGAPSTGASLQRLRSRCCRGILFMGAAFFAHGGYAQTSVTLYGNLDLGINKESGRPARLERGYNNWLGLKGREPLGGGMSATFELQARFNPATGSQERIGTLWQGEASLGLAGSRFGSLRLGRALTPLWGKVWRYEPWQNSGFNASLAAYQTGSYSSDGVNDEALDYADFSRFSNAVFYSSPAFAGVNVDAAAAVERRGDAPARPAGIAVNLEHGALKAMVSFERNARRDTIRFVAASWQFGKLNVMASHTWNSLHALGSERAMVLAGAHAVGADTVRAGYGRNPTLGLHKSSVGYVHALSPRTSLYADLYRERARTALTGVALGMSHAF
jgi:predicted porin